MANFIPIKTKDFSKVFDENFSRIYNYVYFKTGNHVEAEDITADVFTKAFEHFDSYDPYRCSVQTWLRSIAHNTVVDFYRKNHRIIPNGQLILDGLPADTDIEGDYMDRETVTQVLSLIAKLPELHQEVLSLKFFLRMTNREISKVTGLSESNVGTISHRLIRKLKKEMESVELEGQM